MPWDKLLNILKKIVSWITHGSPLCIILTNPSEKKCNFIQCKQKMKDMKIILKGTGLLIIA